MLRKLLSHTLSSRLERLQTSSSEPTCPTQAPGHAPARPLHPVSRTDPSCVPALLQPVTSLSDLLPHHPLAGTRANLSRVAVPRRLSLRQTLGGALSAGTSPGRWLRPPLAKTCHHPGPVDTHSSPSLPLPPGILYLETDTPYLRAPGLEGPRQLVTGMGPVVSAWPSLDCPSSPWLTCPRFQVGPVPNGGRGNQAALGQQDFSKFSLGTCKIRSWVGGRHSEQLTHKRLCLRLLFHLAWTRILHSALAQVHFNRKSKL